MSAYNDPFVDPFEKYKLLDQFAEHLQSYNQEALETAIKLLTNTGYIKRLYITQITEKLNECTNIDSVNFVLEKIIENLHNGYHLFSHAVLNNLTFIVQWFLQHSPPSKEDVQIHMNHRLRFSIKETSFDVVMLLLSSPHADLDQFYRAFARTSNDREAAWLVPDNVSTPTMFRLMTHSFKSKVTKYPGVTSANRHVVLWDNAIRKFRTDYLELMMHIGDKHLCYDVVGIVGEYCTGTKFDRKHTVALFEATTKREKAYELLQEAMQAVEDAGIAHVQAQIEESKLIFPK